MMAIQAIITADTVNFYNANIPRLKVLVKIGDCFIRVYQLTHSVQVLPLINIDQDIIKN